MTLSKQQQTILVSLLLTVLALLALSLWPSKQDQRNAEISKPPVQTPFKREANSPTRTQDNSVSEQPVVAVSTPTQHDQLVVSSTLQGTDIDGALRADANGDLILELGIRDFFDYFLSIADDVGAEQAIAEIQRYAQSYLPEAASLQALELLSNYLRYKKSEFKIQQTPITQETLNDSDALQLLRISFNQLKSKRQSLFSEEQDQALFGLEDSYANHTLSSLELMADDSSSDEQKREGLRALESQLPAELSASFAETRENREYQQSIETELTSNKDDAQVIETLRSQGVEQQQIDSIIERRQQQRQFDSTYSRYLAEKDKLSQGVTELDTDAFQSQLSSLRNRFFANPEDRTLAALRDMKRD